MTLTYYYSDGTTSTELDNNKTLHRKNGPAIERADGSFWLWKIDDKRHKIDGPAVGYFDGSVGYWIDDKYYKEEEFNQIVLEAKALDSILQLTDPRWWVRELGKQNIQSEHNI